jgi:hypothetical protein
LTSSLIPTEVAPMSVGVRENSDKNSDTPIRSDPHGHRGEQKRGQPSRLLLGTPPSRE